MDSTREFNVNVSTCSLIGEVKWAAGFPLFLTTFKVVIPGQPNDETTAAPTLVMSWFNPCGDPKAVGGSAVPVPPSQANSWQMVGSAACIEEVNTVIGPHTCKVFVENCGVDPKSLSLPILPGSLRQSSKEGWAWSSVFGH